MGCSLLQVGNLGTCSSNIRTLLSCGRAKLTQLHMPFHTILADLYATQPLARKHHLPQAKPTPPAMPLVRVAFSRSKYRESKRSFLALEDAVEFELPATEISRYALEDLRVGNVALHDLNCVLCTLRPSLLRSISTKHDGLLQCYLRRPLFTPLLTEVSDNPQ